MDKNKYLGRAPSRELVALAATSLGVETRAPSSGELPTSPPPELVAYPTDGCRGESTRPARARSDRRASAARTHHRAASHDDSHAPTNCGDRAAR